jgi:putative endonuclease
MSNCWVYILASQKYGTLYIGVTSNLPKRIYEHQNGLMEGFTKDYKVHQLVYLEQHETSGSAISREKRLKAWKRDWKINLIEKENPHWEDLSKNSAFDGLLNGSLPSQG